MRETIEVFLQNTWVNDEIASYVVTGILIVVVAVLSIVANIITKKLVLRALNAYITGSRVKWDNILMENKVFERLAHIVPAVIIQILAPVFPTAQEWIRALAFSYMTFVGVWTIDALFNAINKIYSKFEVSKQRPIKGYLQVTKIVVYVMGGIVIIGTLIGKSPWVLISGIGAMTAVLLIVFRDSLLGLVAGVQLAANDMVHLGDWVSMPQYGADGDVIDITLNIVKIQNWDRTITTIPAYAMVSESFTNWKGMELSGGRRISRSVYIDMTSIKFCTDEMLNRFEKIAYISPYIKSKLSEIEAYNKSLCVDTSIEVNGRHLTNIGIFRAYVEQYIKNHPKTHKDMIMMVRQLAPTEHGLPIQVYVFTNDTAWVNYEAIQADIFDHIFAVIPSFDLRLFQEPTGDDFRHFLKENK